ncbi:hypothetical protein MMC28_004081 [Mycoblastus sanguinarius]|nr:hypothetical protein [Mycoblastus sanguinarius]
MAEEQAYNILGLVIVSRWRLDARFRRSGVLTKEKDGRKLQKAGQKENVQTEERLTRAIFAFKEVVISARQLKLQIFDVGCQFGHEPSMDSSCGVPDRKLKIR